MVGWCRMGNWHSCGIEKSRCKPQVQIWVRCRTRPLVPPVDNVYTLIERLSLAKVVRVGSSIERRTH